MYSAEFINHVLNNAKAARMRTGQCLFHNLPDGASKALNGHDIDPFFENFDRIEMMKWVEDHLIFGKPEGEQAEEGIIALFDGECMLWLHPEWNVKSV